MNDVPTHMLDKYPLLNKELTKLYPGITFARVGASIGTSMYTLFVESSRAQTVSLKFAIVRVFHRGTDADDYEIIHGNMRSDGCLNVEFPKDCLIHICEMRDFVQALRYLEATRIKFLED